MIRTGIHATDMSGDLSAYVVPGDYDCQSTLVADTCILQVSQPGGASKATWLLYVYAVQVGWRLTKA